MEGTYPVILEGREQGTIEVRQAGLLTEFRARCADPGTLVRLSLYGEREGYLGVMAPGPEGLELTRRLSRSALRDFPQQPRYAAPAGQRLPDAEEVYIIKEPKDEQKEKTENFSQESLEKTPENKVSIIQEEKKTDPDIIMQQEPKIVDINIDVISAEPVLETAAEEVDITNDTVWYAGPGGCLYGTGEGTNWLAVPAGEADPTGGRGLYREIQGRSYLLFRTGSQSAEKQ